MLACWPDFVNALTLIVIAVWIAIEALHRLSEPVHVQPRLMMIVAAAGVLMNGVIAAMLSRSGSDVNLRSAFIHMLGDTLSTAAVIVGGAAILWTGAVVDRSGAVAGDFRADYLVVALDCAGDVEYSARRHAAGDFSSGDSRVAARDFRR